MPFVSNRLCNMCFRRIITVLLVCLSCQHLCEARRRRNHAETFTFDASVKLYGSPLTATIDVIHITEPENVVEVEISRGTEYEGASIINYDNGVIAVKSKSGGFCGIRYNTAGQVKQMRKTIQKTLNDYKDTNPVLKGVVCKTFGNVRLLSPYGSRISTTCHNLDNNNVLVDFCRYASDEENNAFGNNCDIGFVMIDKQIELACVRIWI